MKILLVGEYSRLHNSLKEGLLKLGHDVKIVGCGDGFKDFPVDIKIIDPYQTGAKKKLKILLYRLFGIDISSNNIKRQLYKQKSLLKGYDVVQLINEHPFKTLPKTELKLIQFLKENNKKMFLLSCGTDRISVQYAMDKKFRYSILTPLFENKVSKEQCFPALKYLRPSFDKLHQYIFQNINGVIASDLDYHIPMKGHPKYLGMIPNAINVDALKFSSLDSNNKITIFHGINCQNYFKKGTDIFEKAISIIQKKHAEKFELLTVNSLPYAEYIERYEKAHIVLDQVYSYDQGYNALEAMAKGKVTFTGAEEEFIAYYNLKDEVAVNVIPDAAFIANKLEELILNPGKIKEIGRNARNFIEKEHHYITVAQRYLDTWTKN